jgi:hypothetical protein
MSLKESIAAGHKILHDANLHKLANIIGCKFSDASAILQRNMAAAMTTKPETLMKRQKAIMILRNGKNRIVEEQLDAAAKAEQELTTYFKESGADKDSLENDAISQLSFQDDILKPLNNVPWMIFLITIFKVWIVPAMTLMTPIVAWVLPYILLRFVYALPIDQQEYAHILQGLWVGNMPQPGVAAPDLWTPRSIAQFLVFGFSFAQSMIQPIQNAMHLNKTDTIITGLGGKLIQLRNIVRKLQPVATELDIKLADVLEELDETDARRAFLLVKENPERLRMVFRDLANLEILWLLATSPFSFTLVNFKPDVLVLEDIIDISLNGGEGSSLTLSETSRRHAIITGPNGGGKSSFLRAILQSVVLGHSYGVAPAATAVMPRFRWIASGLQLRDTPGLYSMFETEVKFAADCIRSSRSAGPGLVLFDELFHSTNPPDGTRSAELFLKQLWAPDAHVYSVVSTHVFPLVESAPDTVDAICCPASERLDGTIEYVFRVEPGVCRVSSVRTVWDKYGLQLR